MEILEDPVFKSKYKKYKLRVKLWESDFTEEHGRKPNKNDIKEADIKIKESYKMYWKLKTRALEETLMDITFTDDVQDNLKNDVQNNLKDNVQNKVQENVQEDIQRNVQDDVPSIISMQMTVQETNTDKELTVDNTIIKDTENIDPRYNACSLTSNDSMIKRLNDAAVAEVGCTNVKNVWGDHLSKSNRQEPQKKKNLLIGRPSSFQLSQNKFTSESFTKRNPRKSLSMSKLKNKPERTSTIVTNPDPVEQPNVNISDDSDAKNEVKPLFGEAVKITYVEAKPAIQPGNNIQQLIEGHTVNRKLNAGWLDRCAKQNNVEYPKFDSQRLSGTSDSGIESMECSIQSPLESAPPSQSQQSVQFSDEEDFICNSDSEEERKNKRIRNFKKRLSDHENHPSKRLCIDNDSSFLNAQNLPNERSIVQASFAINAISNKVQKNNDFGDSNVSSAKVSDAFSNVEISSVNNDVNTHANLSDKKDKHDEQVHTTEKSNADEYDFTNDDEPLSPKRKTRSARRRVKKISSDDSDPDFMEEDKKSTKKKESKAKRARPERKRKVKADDAKGEKETTVRARRSSRKKSLDDTADNENTKDVAQSKEPQIYPIETLQTVPRFTMHSTDTRDLVEQFAKVVSTKTDSTDVSAPSEKLAILKGKLTEKEKLEKKISDGRINENFVRINIKKKVFVRGKKNFNFSKYKKNQWKQRKKELGASGGNLDVADFMEKTGSIRTCFKCGEIGHFARYCTAARGADLLPMDEVQEESQFPTLEEAQKMATLNAFTAHASRPQLLPEKASFSSKIEEAESTQTEQAETSQTEEAESTQTEEAEMSQMEEVEATQTEEADNEDLWEPIDDEALLCGHKIPEELVSRLMPPEIGTVQPLYNVKADQSLIETPSEVLETLRMFGHESFRMGQEKAVMRILSGQSTLVTLSTGSGKSLCYQLPAYLYSKFSHCITLVISPLVSLMDDQVTGVPHFLSAACLHTGQTPKVRENVMQMVKNGKVNILLVSPEAVVAGEKSTGFGALLRQLPPIAFACIDEAHCISQWSHNFRPSYLMVCRVLKEKLRVKTVLALTATATKTTAESIVRHLGIHDGMEGVISDIPMPRNLLLTVSKDEQRDQALVRLLLSERFQECDSVIVYCTRREECVRIAGLLRVHLQDPHSVEKTASKMSCIAEAYHAGLSAYRRKTVQKLFMSGKTRVVVATVAFGMGLNKPDIRAVIHYNMPGTFEGYVQEVGRAGRDGLRAHCHLFLHPKADRDKLELRRHIFTNGIDRHIIRRLLQKVFLPCSCAKLRNANVNRRCPGHEVAIPVDETVAALDISEEIISTLLCYLELHPKRFITVLSSVYVRAKVFSYNGPNALKLAAQSSPPLAMAIAMDLQKGISHENSTSIEFPVVDVASAIGWDSGVVKSHLKNLEWTTVNGQSKRSAITVRYDTLGLRIKAPGDLNEDELDEALDALYGRAKAQETAAVQQLETITYTLQKSSVHSVLECEKLTEEEMVGKSDELKTIIRDYFQGKFVLPEDYAKQEKIENEAEVVGDVRTLILSYRDNNFTGRAVARILHGIQSPNYPAYVWGKCRFWRAHLSCDFNALCQIATKEILALR